METSAEQLAPCPLLAAHLRPLLLAAEEAPKLTGATAELPVVQPVLPATAAAKGEQSPTPTPPLPAGQLDRTLASCGKSIDGCCSVHE